MEIPNYYEFLQISPNAEPDTIHRVFRFLAVRFHPDNPETGNAEQFVLLKDAYDVLSNPAVRAEYDAAVLRGAAQAPPLSSSVDFMDNMDGELNRRLGVLALLYTRRRTSPASPEVSLLEVEERMGFPRDYLDFTTWYLLRKNFITRADNSAFTLTAEGVDFVEAQRGSVPVLNKMLTPGTASGAADSVTSSTFKPRSAPIIVPMPMAPTGERRATGDRRVNQTDRRQGGTDRRSGSGHR